MPLVALTAMIVVEAGMPFPVTTMPTTSPVNAVTPVSWALSLDAFPANLRGTAVKVSEPFPLLIAPAESVMLVPEFTDSTTIPSGTPDPDTSIPAAIPSVVAVPLKVIVDFAHGRKMTSFFTRV